LNFDIVWSLFNGKDEDKEKENDQEEYVEDVVEDAEYEPGKEDDEYHEYEGTGNDSCVFGVIGVPEGKASGEGSFEVYQAFKHIALGGEGRLGIL
jgi:hypothetical protein